MKSAHFQNFLTNAFFKKQYASKPSLYAQNDKEATPQCDKISLISRFPRVFGIRRVEDNSLRVLNICTDSYYLTISVSQNPGGLNCFPYREFSKAEAGFWQVNIPY